MPRRHVGDPPVEFLETVCAGPLGQQAAEFIDSQFEGENRESGRHSRVREFTFFTLIAFASFCAGLFGGPFLIHKFGINSHLSQVGLVVTSALVNFVCRKFLVFKR